MPERFKLRDLVEVTTPHRPVFHGLVAYVRQGLPYVVCSLDEMYSHPVEPEWCRLSPLKLVIEDGNWRLE